MITGLPTPYCDLAHGNDVNGETEEWVSASNDEREAALQWGRVYMDSSYTYGTDSAGEYYNEVDPVPDGIQTANALLGNSYLKGELFDAETQSGTITRQDVKAGSVETRTDYDIGTASANADPVPAVTGLLAGYASRSGGTVSSPTLVRH